MTLILVRRDKSIFSSRALCPGVIKAGSSGIRNAEIMQRFLVMHFIARVDLVLFDDLKYDHFAFLRISVRN